MLIGYARVSTQDQNLDRQLDALLKAGVEEQWIYKEKMSGVKSDRPELKTMLSMLREGDTVIVADLTRLSRSTKDLFNLLDKIQKKGANLKSLKEAWIDTTTPTGRLMFTIIAGISQFERDLISQRTKEGLESARARGRLGGRREKLTAEQKQAVIALYKARELSIKEICSSFGITKPTLYKIMEEIG